MDQPPLIDVDPEDEKMSKLAGCAGCLTRALPVFTGLLLLVVVGLGVTYFILGGDLRDKELAAEQAAGEDGKSTEPEKKGFLEKIKSAVKGEKEVKEEEVLADSGEGAQAESGTDAVEGAVEKSEALAEAVGAEGKSPEERNQLLKEKFGHLEEDGDPAPDAADDLPGFPDEAAEETGEANRRGGSFGSSTGVASQEDNKPYMIWRSDLSTAGSDLECEIIFQETGGQLHFRLFLLPYDSSTSKWFRSGKGDFLVSFTDGQGQRLIPAKEDFLLPLSKMTAFENRGKVAGWVSRGIIPMDGVEPADLSSVRLGWDFDPDLSAWLKELKLSRGE